MQAIDQLTLEHQTISKKLTFFIGSIDAKNEQIITVARTFLAFVKNYVDKYHNEKEEHILLPWLLKQNSMLEQGPISTMRLKYDQGRQIIKTMDELIEANGSEPDSNNLLKILMKRYEKLLSDHIRKEEYLLYHIAEVVNANIGDGDEIMLPEFQKVEKLHGKMAQDLVSL